jgi:hypothetical protein
MYAMLRKKAGARWFHIAAGFADFGTWLVIGCLRCVDVYLYHIFVHFKTQLV